MKTIKPDYFDAFKCKANKCIDSCCSAGWQINVDNNAINRYCNLKDKFFADVNNFLNTDKKSKFFKQQNGKCLFFKDGLCSLVTKYGDKYLCDVCRDYPRFYNFVGDVNLIGLSLDCEEVANIVLNKTNPVKFITNNSKSKDAKLEQKLNIMFEIINLLQNRSLTIQQRINNVLKMFDCKEFCCDKTIFELLKQLEWLNFVGAKFADFLNDKKVDTNFKYNDIIIENLLVYFVFRYFVNKNKKVSDIAKIKFVIFCVWCIDKMQNFVDSEMYYQFKPVTLFCRQIEYSTKNVDLLLKFFDND